MMFPKLPGLQLPGKMTFCETGAAFSRFRVGFPRGSGVPLHETGGFVSRNKDLVKSYPNKFLTCRNMDGIGQRKFG